MLIITRGGHRTYPRGGAIFFVETGEGFQQGDLVEAWPTAVQKPHPKPVVDNGQLFAVVDLSLVGDSELVGQAWTVSAFSVNLLILGLTK